MSRILIERHDHTALVTLNRPEVRNAVDREMSIALGDALHDADHDPDVWAIVITGAGELAFCAGADLKAVGRGESVHADDDRRARWGFAGIVSHQLVKPVIAAVNGYAMGGGTEIVLSCDLAVASTSASFGLPEVTRGLIAAAGGAFRLPEQIPKKIAMEMMLTGQPISAERAFEIGLVNAVVAPHDLLSASMKLAQRICANAPLAVQASKAIAIGLEGAEDSKWALSQQLAKQILGSLDAREGATAFIDHRTPVWQAK